ncbi:MAG: hypothetical protein ACRD13_09415 [Terriglobales bacterium]
MPPKKLSLDDMRHVLIAEIAAARADGSHKSVIDAISELRQLELAQMRLLPEGSDRLAMLHEFTDAEIEREFERRGLQGRIVVEYRDDPLEVPVSPRDSAAGA